MQRRLTMRKEKKTQEHDYSVIHYSFLLSLSVKPATNPIPTPLKKPSINKIHKSSALPTFAPNSNPSNPTVITTQFPSTETKNPVENKEPSNESKTAQVVPVPIQRQSSGPIPSITIVNGNGKKSTPPGTVTEKSKATVQRSLSSSIFVPPPMVPPAPAVRLSSNIEVDRLHMEDLALKEKTLAYESYIDDLIEEVIQSDFEKPSIPEVILAVITDLTNDGDGFEEIINPMDQEYSNGSQQIYNFSQDKARSTSPMIINSNNNPTNANTADTDYYYTRVHQTVTNMNDLNHQESIRVNNNSNQNSALVSAIDPSSNYLQVSVKQESIELN